MPSPVDVQRALAAAAELNPGPDQVKALELAVADADALGDHRLAVQARIDLVAALENGRPGEDELAHLGWLLNALENPDEPVSERQRFQILWECRYALARGRRSSRVPLPALSRMYADTERRYRLEGASPHAYAKYRALLAADTEPDEAAERWWQRWRETPRDEFADCEACDLALSARLRAEEGDYEGALRTAADLLEGRTRCADEPSRLFGAAADWAMRAGYVEVAEACHRLGWVAIEGEPRLAAAMADHLIYLARAGRIGRAVRLALEMLPTLGEGIDELDAMAVSGVIARVLRAGRGHQILPAQIEGRPMAEVIEDLEETGRKIAAAFDARNRTDRVSRRLAELVRMRPYPASASADMLTLDSLERAVLGAPATETPPSTPLPAGIADFAVALRSASDTLDAPRVTELVEGWVRVRDRLLPATTPAEHRDVAYLDRRALASTSARRDPGMARQLLDGAVSAAQASGDQTTLTRTEIEVLQQAGLAGDPTAYRQALELVNRLEESGEPVEAAGALMALSRHPDPRQGMAFAQRAAALFAGHGAFHWEATALQAAGFAAAWVDPGSAQQLLERAHERATALALPQLAVAIRASQGKAAQLRGDLDGAADLYQLAVEGSDAFGSADPFALGVQYAESLIAIRAWGRLRDEARTMADRAGPTGEVHHLAVAHRFLGLAQQELGRPHEAVEVLGSAVQVLRAAQDPLVGPADWAYGLALAAVDRPDLAVPHFERAAEEFTRTEGFSEAYAAHEAAGSALWALAEHEDAAVHFTAAAEMARRSGDREGLVAALRALADAHAHAGRLDDALHTLDRVFVEAREVADDSPFDEQRLLGHLDHQGGLMLLEAGRTADAEHLLKEALNRLGAYGRRSDAAAVRAALARLDAQENT